MSGRPENVLGQQEKTTEIKTIISNVIGFEAKDIEIDDQFINDYRISYPERKNLLEKLNETFAKELSFEEFCKLNTVGAVIEFYAEKP